MYGFLKIHATDPKNQLWVRLFRAAYIMGTVAWAWQFFLRFVFIFSIYKVYDMICFDYFLLMKFHFFQYYYPEVKSVYPLKKIWV